ncbi:MAG: DUF2892 domain-containing protein [Bacteroidota bacterium]
MKTNVGTADRIIRISVGIIVAALYFAGMISGMTATILLVLAAVFIITGFISFCPLYAIFGISSCRRPA